MSRTASDCATANTAMSQLPSSVVASAAQLANDPLGSPTQRSQLQHRMHVFRRMHRPFLPGRNRQVLAALPSQSALPIMHEVESVFAATPGRIRVAGLEFRRSYAET